MSLKNPYILIILLIGVLANCSTDENNGGGGGDANGIVLPNGYAWVIETMSGVEASRSGYIFKSDGSCELVIYMSGSWEKYKTCAWSVNGNNLTMTIEGNPTETYFFSVTSTELSLDNFFVYTKMQIGPVGNGNGNSDDSSSSSDNNSGFNGSSSSSDGSDDSSSSDEDSGSDNSSSSIYIEPEPSSSSKIEIVYGGELSDSRDNQTYKTVVIGNQTWMAQNLNYFPPGTNVSPYGVSNTGVSACYADSSSYKINGQDFHITADSSSKNCEKYGRLYDWSTAMAFAQDCNKKQCKPTNTDKHQGVCPSGWHVPTDDEWTELKNFAGGEFEGGPNLKATYSWDDYSNVINWETYEKETLSGNGFDAYGFSALAGGYFNAGDGIENMNIFAAKGQYHGIGKQGYWWTATEYTNQYTGASVQAVSRLIKNEAYHVQSERQNKGDNWFYVRCVKD